MKYSGQIIRSASGTFYNHTSTRELTTAMAKTVVAFDAYGTLLSTAGIADHLSKHFPSDTATELATVWRKHQLEYTWRLNSMSTYLFPF